MTIDRSLAMSSASLGRRRARGRQPAAADAHLDRGDDPDARRRRGSSRRSTRPPRRDQRAAADRLPAHAVRRRTEPGAASRPRSPIFRPTATSSCCRTFAAGSSPKASFVMLRQPRDRKDPKAIDESTDTYDTIEWLLKNVPNNNGRVGMVGTSYRRVARGDGRARSASGAQGHRADGVARGHVARRRLPSQRRVSPELRPRVRLHDGVVEGDHLRRDADRSLRHLRLVSRARPAVERQSPLLPRVAADLE